MSGSEYNLLPNVSDEVRSHLVEHLKTAGLHEMKVDCSMTGQKRPDIQSALFELSDALESEKVIDEFSFIKGVCFALSRMDTGSPEYVDIVNQAGGFKLLMENADDCDLEHLKEAKRRLKED